MGGCGDVVRNITGCPVAGVDHDELFDVTGLVRETADFFYGNREYSDLPRKHKISIAACRYPVQRAGNQLCPLVGMIKDGREGFAVRVGGGQILDAAAIAHLGVFHYARTSDSDPARDYRCVATAPPNTGSRGLRRG